MHPHGHGVLVLWKYVGTSVRPVAALGSAYTLRATFHAPIPDRRDRVAIQDTGFLTNVIAGYQPDQKFFTWTDLNDDAQVQVNELKFGALSVQREGADGRFRRLELAHERAVRRSRECGREPRGLLHALGLYRAGLSRATTCRRQPWQAAVKA